jgi:hypothetical protein
VWTGQTIKICRFTLGLGCIRLIDESGFGQKRNDKMRVTDLMEKGVVFIGHNGLSGDFIADGTGFVLMFEAYGFAFPYVVTAKHVVDQAAGRKTPQKDVLIRFNLKVGGVDYLKTALSSWHTHPDHLEKGGKPNYIDVAAFGLCDYEHWAKSDIDKYDFSYLMEADICTNEIIQKYNIGLGDEVVIPGLFHSHIGTQRNVPIVRTGNIAAMRGEPVPTSNGLADAYLVEMRSVGGISGSPVLTHMAIRPDEMHPESENPTRIEKSKKTHFLLGIIQGHYTITTQDEWIFKTDQLVGDINAGVAVVIPSSKIVETICQPTALGKEQEVAKKMREHQIAISGAVDDSAPKVTPSKSDISVQKKSGPEN